MLCPDFHELGQSLPPSPSEISDVPSHSAVKKNIFIVNSGNFLVNYVDTIWWFACFIAENALLHIY